MVFLNNLTKFLVVSGAGLVMLSLFLMGCFAIVDFTKLLLATSDGQLLGVKDLLKTVEPTWRAYMLCVGIFFLLLGALSGALARSVELLSEAKLKSE